MNIPDDDPTFRSSGVFWVRIINATNVPFVVSYTELRDPGKPPWVHGEHWRRRYGNLSSIRDGVTSCAEFALVNDRGPKAVMEGHTYQFETEVRGDLYLKLVFRIKGVDGGSVVAPGFGLCDGDKWTYYFPERFTGRWGISYSSPTFAGPCYLTAIYNDFRRRKVEWSALSFELKGSRVGHFMGQSPEEGTALPMEDVPSSVETAGGVVITHEPL